MKNLWLKKFLSQIGLIVTILTLSVLVSAGVATADRTPVVSSPTTIGGGGTNSTSQVSNGINYFNGTRITSLANFVFNGTNAGIGSSSPDAKLSVMARSGETNPLVFSIASSTPTATSTLLSTTRGGQTTSCETVYGSTTNGAQFASSTAMTIDSQATCNHVLLQVGTAAFTVTFTNIKMGDTKLVTIANPNAAAGAVTWAGVVWFGGTTPTQTTTASTGDAYSCYATQATSTTAASLKMECAQNAGLQ